MLTTTRIRLFFSFVLIEIRHWSQGFELKILSSVVTVSTSLITKEISICDLKACQQHTLQPTVDNSNLGSATFRYRPATRIIEREPSINTGVVREGII